MVQWLVSKKMDIEFSAISEQTILLVVMLMDCFAQSICSEILLEDCDAVSSFVFVFSK